MTVLLLRLAGPLQSWGDSSRFTIRATRREPTKSGVLGLLAAAQGRRRTDSIEDLLTLRFGVRTDQPGSVIRDFHSAIDWAKVKPMPLSNRYYLSDAVFVAGVEGDPTLVHGLDDAIKDPQFPLYLGRRSCPTEGQVSLGVRDGDLVEALKDEPWHAKTWHRRRQGRSVRLPIAYDAAPGQPGNTVRDIDTVRDIPLSFNPERREYGWRDVATIIKVVDNPNGTDEPDWFAGLEGA
ncbi:type I-E CRISPR-associated protein Cas5/CasD [Cutibacterium sp.]|uniref:type I-E CRISPR-associated protein Cas5/CasD n=1 Tax=Cutibacterium sp. TaxID=1912221 RepID=UPI0026DDC0F3|nr:type I-E CRISPR-associated protein Cas5/CasD [Cutibacterium sp.]MDO4412396.1 type I-E CRISPR-associated protein Cas5/CasD [Cutibacterium sp.]